VGAISRPSGSAAAEDAYTTISNASAVDNERFMRALLPA
jgi:hypothetical protein